MSARRCGICREVGHNRRNCPRANHRNQQYDRICYTCGIPGHDPPHCPMMNEIIGDYQRHVDVIAEANPDNIAYIDVEIDIDENDVAAAGDTCILCGSYEHDIVNCPIARSQFNQRSVSAKKKIYWDKCGKCGTENTGSKYCCSCGEKHVIPVPKNDNGVHECTICYVNLRELNKVTTKCGHHFCIDCFLSHHDSNQASSGDCPMCRAQILEVEEEPDGFASNQEHIIDTIRSVHRQLLNF